MGNDKKIEDVNSTTSDRTGVLGILEVLIRRFRTIGFLFMLGPIIIVGALVIGMSLTPGVFLVKNVSEMTQGLNAGLHFLSIGISLGVGYLLYGISVIFVAPFFNFILPFRIKPSRGPWYSISSIPWYYHNALTYIVRYTSLDLFTPSPLNNIFYKLMGMKIGKGVVINTTNISDPGLITLDDFVMLGGSVTIFAHYAMKGYLVQECVHIKKGANIGLGATIMGNVVIGEKARVMPHAVVLPGAVVEDGATVPDIEKGSIYIAKKKIQSEEKLKLVSGNKSDTKT